jgi:hypothetical protein
MKIKKLFQYTLGQSNYTDYRGWMTQTPFSTITLFPKRKPTVSSSPNPVAIKTQSPPPPTLSPLETPPREI